MTIFISYSHADKDFVDRLAIALVKERATVWIDRWELNVGDSIVQRVQAAMTGAGALLVVLSKQSIASAWCKRELSAGLVREMEERRVVVLPVLLEDCEIPLFLREKMYADFRTDFEFGLKATLEGIAAVSNANQSRLVTQESNVDWAEDWHFEGDALHLRYTVIEHPTTMPMTFLTEIQIICNEVATKRYRQFEAAGIDWIGRSVISEFLFDLGKSRDLRILLDNQQPQVLNAGITDTPRGTIYQIKIVTRKLGDDNGRDQLIDISQYLQQIRAYIREAAREPSPNEREEMMRIIRSPWPP